MWRYFIGINGKSGQTFKFKFHSQRNTSKNNISLSYNISSYIYFYYTISIFKVRLGGSKGVLLLNPSIKDCVHLRTSSMCKYDIPTPTESQRTIEVLHYSFPSLAFLNRQIIMFLSGLGIPDQYFLDLQRNYLEDLADFQRFR